MSKKAISIEEVFDVLGWGEGIEANFADAEVFPNQDKGETSDGDNYWEITLHLKNQKVFEHKDITGVSIYSADGSPLQLTFRCLSCFDGVAAHFTLDDSFAIKAILKEYLDVFI